MSEQRHPNDLLSLNKEGLVSCVGYWALYLWGVAISHLLHTTLHARLLQHFSPAVGGAGGHGHGGSDSVGVQLGGGPAQAANANGGSAAVDVSGQRLVSGLARCLAELAAADVALWALLWALEAAVEPVSRR